MRRRFVRIPFQTGGVFTCQGQNYQATLIDLSLTGALVHCAEVEASLGDCLLAIPLSAEVVLSFRAEIMHAGHGQLGCRFTGMSPATFTHLVRLLELNAEEEGQIERELRNLARQPQLASAAAH